MAALSIHLKTVALNVCKYLVKRFIDRIAVGLNGVSGIAITAIQNRLPSGSVHHQRTAAVLASSIELIHLPSFSNQGGVHIVRRVLTALFAY